MAQLKGNHMYMKGNSIGQDYLQGTGKGFRVSGNIMQQPKKGLI